MNKIRVRQSIQEETNKWGEKKDLPYSGNPTNKCRQNEDDEVNKNHHFVTIRKESLIDAKTSG